MIKNYRIINFYKKSWSQFIYSVKNVGLIETAKSWNINASLIEKKTEKVLWDCFIIYLINFIIYTYFIYFNYEHSENKANLKVSSLKIFI